MFDWNDEELANIIWGEAGETDDHIVPYPEGSEDLHNKKEWNQEASAARLIEQKRPEAKIDIHGRKPGSSSNLENDRGLSASGFGANSWPELSLSNAAKADQGSLGTDVSKNLTKISKHISSRAAQLEKDAGIFQNANEGEDQGDFVDYGWANIRSFDDLDRMFSNDDPIFGHVNLDNADELWSSSKELSNNSSHLTLATANPAGDLRNRFEPSKIKAEYVTCDDQSFSISYKRLGSPPSASIQNAHAVPVDEAYVRAGRKATGKEQQNMLKTRKKPYERQEGKVLQDLCGNWSPLIDHPRQFENQVAPSVIQPSPTSVLAQQKQIQGTESLYQNINNSYAASPMYGGLTNTYVAMPMQSQAQSQDVRHHPLLSGYEVSPSAVNAVKKSVDLVKPLTMTPQEKIEKLRRRQQMQAMLAIQKQRQQLGQQVPCTNKSITQKCPLEIQSHLCDGDDPEIEDLSILPALDHPIEQDDSNTISLAVNDYFAEETILYNLQDVISKMDIKIRLCIRDSLFRLAQSAMQRHHISDKSGTNTTSREEFDVIARDSYSQNRYVRTPDAETGTNPIDRTVAHLLFHGPLDLTGNLADKLDSPISARMQSTSKMANLANLRVGCLPEEDVKSNQQCSHQVFKNARSLFEAQTMDQFKSNPCVDTSENASNNGPADVGAQELEASQ